MERKNAENLPGKSLKGVPEGKTIEQPGRNETVQSQTAQVQETYLQRLEF